MFVLGVLLFVLSLGGAVCIGIGSVKFNSGSDAVWFIVFVAGLIGFIICGFFGHRIFKKCRYKEGKRGVNTVFYYLTIVQYYFAGLFKFNIWTKRVGSETKSAMRSFMENQVNGEAPNSSESYQTECKELYERFCAKQHYDTKNRKLTEEFEKQFYKRVYG